jgi:hypothetical protein
VTEIVSTISECLGSVRNARFFDTERGYQGELYAELRARLPAISLPGDAIVEEEYQKRLPEHGVRVRPDIIVHIPTPSGGNRRHGNFAVLELKLSAGPTAARKDFAKLDAVLDALHYPLGVFVNICSAQTHAAHYRGAFGERIHFFAVQRVGRGIQLRHARSHGSTFIEETHELE